MGPLAQPFRFAEPALIGETEHTKHVKQKNRKKRETKGLM
jgi:hypothetical protein